MAGSYKSDKLGKRPEGGSKDNLFTGTMKNRTKANTGSVGSASDRSSPYSSGASGSGWKKSAKAAK
jgi:hypothetical protein